MAFFGGMFSGLHNQKNPILKIKTNQVRQTSQAVPTIVYEIQVLNIGFQYNTATGVFTPSLSGNYLITGNARFGSVAWPSGSMSALQLKGSSQSIDENLMFAIQRLNNAFTGIWIFLEQMCFRLSPTPITQLADIAIQ